MLEVNEKAIGPTERGCSHQEETVKALGPEGTGLVDALKLRVAGWL